MSLTKIMTLVLASVLAVKAQDLEDFKPKPDTPNIKLSAKEIIIEDAERKTKHLQFEVSLENREFLAKAPGLTIHLLVFGKYQYRSHQRELRMVLNQTQQVDLKAHENLTWKSDIMYSGKNQPEHINYGIKYMGYLVILTDKNGNEVQHVSTMQPFYQSFSRLKKVPSGQDFPNPILRSR